MNTDFNSSEELEHLSSPEETNPIEPGDEDPSEADIVKPSEKPEDEEGQVKPIPREERNPKKKYT